MTKRPYHHGDLPAALLAQAERTVREKGVSALSLRELARDVGVSPGAPRRHFASKQDLLDALARTGFERLAEAIETAVAGAGETFAARLDAAARAYVDFATANPALLDLMFTAKHSPEASEPLGAAADRWVEHCLDVVRDGQRRGEVRDGPLERVALAIMAPLHGYATLAVSGKLPPDGADHGLDDVIAATLRGCEPEEGPAR